MREWSLISEPQGGGRGGWWTLWHQSLGFTSWVSCVVSGNKGTLVKVTEKIVFVGQSHCGWFFFCNEAARPHSFSDLTVLTKHDSKKCLIMLKSKTVVSAHFTYTYNIMFMTCEIRLFAQFLLYVDRKWRLGDITQNFLKSYPLKRL